MTNIKDIVITLDNIKKLGMLLDTTTFSGIGFDKVTSLLEFGIVYDNMTETCIVTYPDYVWDSKESPIKFGVVEITSEQINKVFEENKELILTQEEITEEYFYGLNEVMKIWTVESYTSGLGLLGNPIDKTVDELFEYLEEYIEKHD